MKRILGILLLLILTFAGAAEKLPELTWRFFFPLIPHGHATLMLPVEDNVLYSNGLRVKATPVEWTPGGSVDLQKTGEINDNQFAIAVADFHAEKAGRFVLGIGSNRSLILSLNGEKIFDSMNTGNDESPVSVHNHPVRIDYAAGKNQLVVELFRPLQFAARAVPYIPPEIKFQPWASFPDAANNRMRISFESNIATPAAIDLRSAGEPVWHRISDTVGGELKRRVATHNIELESLSPSTNYEYRIVLFDEASAMREVLPGTIYSFRTLPDKNDFSFVATGDLQGSAADRRAMFQQLFSPEWGGNSAFFAYLGNVSQLSDFDLSMMRNFLQPYRDTPGALPLVMVRGNHEYEGREANRYFDFFNAPFPGREGYFLFRCGDACFIVLDCGDVADREAPPSVRAGHDLAPYLARQSAWLKKAVALPVCRDAKYRIVLAHGVPVGDRQTFMPDNIRKMIDPVFGGDSPLCRIHLWLGGHVHYALRSTPGQAGYRSAVDPSQVYLLQKMAPLTAPYVFPVVAVSGPSLRWNSDALQSSGVKVDVTKEQLVVAEFDRNGKVFDCFSIAPDGTFKELGHADFFRDYGR